MAGVLAKLFDNNDTTKGNVVLVQVVAKDLLENAPALHASIEGFMPASRNVHAMLVFKANGLIFRKDLGVAAISFVGDDAFAWTQHVLQPGAKDAEIYPFPTLKGTIERDNVAGLDTDANLVPQTRPIGLVRVPLPREGPWLQDLKVNTINCHEASLIRVVAETILPANLMIDENNAWSVSLQHRKKAHRTGPGQQDTDRLTTIRSSLAIPSA